VLFLPSSSLEDGTSHGGIVSHFGFPAYQVGGNFEVTMIRRLSSDMCRDGFVPNSVYRCGSTFLDTVCTFAGGAKFARQLVCPKV
jgi:hypothetical protein